MIASRTAQKPHNTAIRKQSMISRAIKFIISLAVSVLIFVACNNGQPPPAEPHTPEYLTQEIPPCTPLAGSSVDPCLDEEPYMTTAGGTGHPDFGDGPRSVRESLGYGRSFVTHLVLRGTYLTDTVRCTAGNPFRPPSYLSYDEYDFVEQSLSFNCYVDVQVGAYAIGNGPSVLTVQRFFYTYRDGELAFYAEEQGQTEQEYIEDFRQLLESDEYLGGIVGKEEFLLIGPAASVSTEVWQVMTTWDVQRREDGTVIAVHPERDLWRTLRPDEYQSHLSKLEMPLPAFTQAVTTAHQARVTEYGGRIGEDQSLPMLITDANKLRDYYAEVGAYAPGVPTPAPPPPASQR